MNKSILSILLFVSVSLSSLAQGLRTSVCTVYPEFDSVDSTMMTAFARELGRVGFTNDAQMLRAYTAHAFGSGVLTDHCVLTNRHVVGYAPTVKLVFELHDRTLTFEHCRVLSTSTTSDIAAIELPNNMDGLYTLSLSEQEVQDGEDIYAAGFPGLGSEASWQLSRGSISNTQLRVGSDMYIQHTAPIDPGSSGGPLLRKVDGKFQVIGLNTMKAFGRDRVGLAINTEQIQQFLQAPHNLADQQLLEAYHNIDIEHWHEYYTMLSDSMKQVLHDMDVHLPMDRVIAVVNYYGGPDAIQKKTEKKTSGRQDYDRRLDSYKIGLAELDHNIMFQLSYDYYFGQSQRHMVTLFSGLIRRWGMYGGRIGYTSSQYMNTYWRNINNEEVLVTDTSRTNEIILGPEAGLNFPVRIATSHYLVPRLTLSALVGIDFAKTGFVFYLPVQTGVDYHYEGGSVDMVLGVGYTLLPNIRKISSNAPVEHALQVRLGFSF